jgi:hypothetical protein
MLELLKSHRCEYEQLISSPKFIQKEIERLYDRRKPGHGLHALSQEGLHFEDVMHDVKGVAKALARDIANEKYSLSPAKIRIILTPKGKEREVFSYLLMDTLVGAVLAAAINQILEPLLSDRLFSYRKGFNWHGPVKEIAKYFRDYNKRVKQTKSKELFILRRDIKSYTDTIPVSENSPLWSQLSNLLYGVERAEEFYCFRLLKDFIRPTISCAEGDYVLYQGIPTGQPITATLYNSYMMGLDKLFNQDRGYYCRYSDDLIYIHDELDHVCKVEQMMNDHLQLHGVEFKKEKTKNFYITHAARPCVEWDGSKGVDQIDFLGCSIRFNGTVTLKPSKIKRIFKEFKFRIINTLNSVSDDESMERKGRMLCQSLNVAILAQSAHLQERSLDYLKYVVTDRDLLHDIDYKLAMLVSNSLTGIHGVKSFRKVSYRKIREDWKLLSFEHLRNKYGN